MGWTYLPESGITGARRISSTSGVCGRDHTMAKGERNGKTTSNASDHQCQCHYMIKHKSYLEEVTIWIFAPLISDVIYRPPCSIDL
jgi:hypothetical protein